MSCLSYLAPLSGELLSVSVTTSLVLTSFFFLLFFSLYLKPSSPLCLERRWRAPYGWTGMVRPMNDPHYCSLGLSEAFLFFFFQRSPRSELELRNGDSGASPQMHRCSGSTVVGSALLLFSADEHDVSFSFFYSLLYSSLIPSFFFQGNKCWECWKLEPCCGEPCNFGDGECLFCFSPLIQ